MPRTFPAPDRATGPTSYGTAHRTMETAAQARRHPRPTACRRLPCHERAAYPAPCARGPETPADITNRRRVSPPPSAGHADDGQRQRDAYHYRGLASAAPDQLDDGDAQAEQRRHPDGAFHGSVHRPSLYSRPATGRGIELLSPLPQRYLSVPSSTGGHGSLRQMRSAPRGPIRGPAGCAPSDTASDTASPVRPGRAPKVPAKDQEVAVQALYSASHLQHAYRRRGCRGRPTALVPIQHSRCRRVTYPGHSKIANRSNVPLASKPGHAALSSRPDRLCSGPHRLVFPEEVPCDVTVSAESPRRSRSAMWP